jgi:hypothetical protein
MVHPALGPGGDAAEDPVQILVRSRVGRYPDRARVLHRGGQKLQAVVAVEASFEVDLGTGPEATTHLHGFLHAGGPVDVSYRSEVLTLMGGGSAWLQTRASGQEHPSFRDLVESGPLEREEGPISYGEAGHTAHRQPDLGRHAGQGAAQAMVSGPRGSSITPGFSWSSITPCITEEPRAGTGHPGGIILEEC